MVGKWRLISLALLLQPTFCNVLPQIPLTSNSLSATNQNISMELFNDLEELSRIVDISYCVGITGTGIQKPFLCASRCQDFENFELVTEYVPYPGNEDHHGPGHLGRSQKRSMDTEKVKCTDCTVHLGFLTSWQYTKPLVLPHVEELVQKYPDYKLTLVGHSLGGAVAALASLDFQARGWNPQVTTFGEPKIGNQGLIEYLDKTFAKAGEEGITSRYRRVTHVDDPVPLLPLTEWGYQPHAGEVYISKSDLSPEVQDLQYCEGDADPNCIAGAEIGRDNPTTPTVEQRADIEGLKDWWIETKGTFSIPPRWRVWQILFAHRDYFWKLGLCVPRLNPEDRYRKNPHDDDDELKEL
ncbi:MAG: hypothetical protein Q9217_000292 [Psora testacea]